MGKQFEEKSTGWLALPAVGWLLWFLAAPIAIVFFYSFLQKGPYGNVIYTFSFDNYSRAGDWLYLRVLWNSLRLATLTTLSCLCLGYPMAYVMATASKRLRQFLMILIVIPFWSNLVLRAYAIRFLLGRTGPLSQFLVSVGIFNEPIALSDGNLAVWFGMVTNYLPFMVLPLYVTLEKFDFTLFEAAKDLGANSLDLLRRVLFPLTRKGIVTGCILVFIPALGEFVIPELLGGARTMLIGNLITEQFLKVRDWPFGSALSILLITPVLLALFINPKEGEGSSNWAKARGAEDDTTRMRKKVRPVEVTS